MTKSWIPEHQALVSGILLGVGSTVALFHYRGAIAQMVCSWRMLRSIKTVQRNVHVVTNEESWAKVLPRLQREAQHEGAVGFDCEWVQVKGSRRPVALMQLASCSGLCVLVRLSHMKPNFPSTLKTFLEDKSVLKVGIGPIDDSSYLAVDYDIKVQGCVDLRYLVLQCHRSESSGPDTLGGGKSAGGMGLNALSQKYLGRTLDKDWRVRASNWEADTLTKRQERYAAEDALAGIHILVMLVERLWVLSSPLIPFLPLPRWHHHLSTAVHQTCQGLLDLKFCNPTRHQNGGLAPSNRPGLSMKMKTSYRSYCTRKGPLYHNCQLWAPDDEPLCTCDPKKAFWYVEKGLGELVSEDPVIVRLNFEPAGRSLAEREDGKFYLQERQNICVVCGKNESYIRKNVVPHEYRKHFPDILKDHQSHDVVLLCIDCHRQSNLHDNTLRSKLAKEFNSPIGTEQDVKVIMDSSLKSVRSAAGALLQNRARIPQKRIMKLENIVKNFFEIEEITEDHLQNAATLNVNILNENYQAHGQRIYEAYKKVGIVKLEQRWRQHFLDTMKPHYMPDGWSVTHNICKIHLKMSHYPLDHPERLRYKILLVGSEGMIDIPYNPQQDPVNSKIFWELH
ncbi:exonuclease 3'-5' domain-containing protein 2-like isoform X1 [Panulirus ornatus]|uniref:exonuclease 3'-5' domain-containing protein 2-like isoform X1 n=2 Tax=Panulirus ornatus TaxID=150431 RepID=UPI003A8B7E05